MAARRTLGPDSRFERAGVDLYRDTRTGFVRVREALKSGISGVALAMAAVATAAEPGLVTITVPLAILYAAWVLTRRVVLPLRLPMGARRPDHNHPDPKTRGPRMAEGILYLGRDYRTGQELWLGNEDGRQHVAVPGTTGAGKTKALLSLCVNALAWGSGFIFVDGKADNRLYADVLALARLYGREDDVMALNFLVASGNKDSMTFNPFAWGNANVIRELLVSQIESNPNGGDKGANHIFMARAITLMGALTPVLVWMRDAHGVLIDIESIRFATDLESIVSLAKDKVFRHRDPATGTITGIPVPDINEALVYPLRSYLGESGGYDLSQPVHKQRDPEPAKQHSFAVMHFSATFTQLAVSLGHIFKCEIGDIDMRDVVLNRRILVVNLPSLENSGETTAALGRLVVASLRNMMAQTVGTDLKGHTDEVIKNRPHLAPTPFPVVFDEVGYYVVPGMDKMLAMGRGLGFMFYLGFQEVAGLHARIGETMYSLLGNANLQILMRLQEGSETRKYVEQTVGDTHVTQASGFNANDNGGFRETGHAEIRQIARVAWNDLRNLIEGEAIIVMGKERVYAKLFYADVDAHGELRMNQSVMLRPPLRGDVERDASRLRAVAGHLAAGRAAMPIEPAPSPTLTALIHGFAARMQAADPLPVEACASAAILALKDVHSDEARRAPALRAAPGKPNPDVLETEHAVMLDSTARPVDAAPLPDAARQPPSAEAANGLAAIEAEAGASPADARVLMNQTAAVREQAEREDAAAHPVAPIAREDYRALLDGLSDELDGIAPSARLSSNAA